MAGNPVVLAVLQTVVSDLARQTGRDGLDIVDAGGGTGGGRDGIALGTCDLRGGSGGGLGLR